MFTSCGNDLQSGQQRVEGATRGLLRTVAERERVWPRTGREQVEVRVVEQFDAVVQRALHDRRERIQQAGQRALGRRRRQPGLSLAEHARKVRRQPRAEDVQDADPHDRRLMLRQPQGALDDPQREHKLPLDRPRRAALREYLPQPFDRRPRVELIRQRDGHLRLHGPEIRPDGVGNLGYRPQSLGDQLGRHAARREEGEQGRHHPAVDERDHIRQSTSR